MPILINLDVQLAQQKMGVNELADAIGITPVNVSALNPDSPMVVPETSR